MDNRQDRYEITVDADEAGEMEYNSSQEIGHVPVTIPEAGTQRLKSAVTKRKGRGFSSAATALPTIPHFETLQEESSGRAMRSVEGWTLFVSGLHEECTEDDLLDRFGEYGRVRDVKLNLDHRTGYVKGYALVEYETYTEAKAAVEALSGETFMESILECDFAFAKPPQA